jgi:hypothetical protein
MMALIVSSYQGRSYKESLSQLCYHQLYVDGFIGVYLYPANGTLCTYLLIESVSSLTFLSF